MADVAQGKHRGLTEDELFGRRQHVKRESDFVLVALALEPAQQRRRVQCESEEEDDGGAGENGRETDGCGQHDGGGRGVEEMIVGSGHSVVRWFRTTKQKEYEYRDGRCNGFGPCSGEAAGPAVDNRSASPTISSLFILAMTSVVCSSVPSSLLSYLR